MLLAALPLLLSSHPTLQSSQSILGNSRLAPGLGVTASGSLSSPGSLHWLLLSGIWTLHPNPLRSLYCCSLCLFGFQSSFYFPRPVRLLLLPAAGTFLQRPCPVIALITMSCNSLFASRPSPLAWDPGRLGIVLCSHCISGPANGLNGNL